MSKELVAKLGFELMWWILTGIVAYLIVSPVSSAFLEVPDSADLFATKWFNYPTYRLYNIFFIFVAITAIRFIFLLPRTLFAQNIPVKIVLIFACIPIVFTFVERIQSFQEFVDLEGLPTLESWFKPYISAQQRMEIFNYFKKEYVLCGITAVVSCLILPIRFIISIWRNYNETGV